MELQLTTENGKIFTDKLVDDRGRVYIGTDYANETVNVAIEVQEE